MKDSSSHFIAAFVILIITVIVSVVLFTINKPLKKNPSKEALSPNSELFQEFLGK